MMIRVQEFHVRLSKAFVHQTVGQTFCIVSDHLGQKYYFQNFR